MTHHDDQGSTTSFEKEGVHCHRHSHTVVIDIQGGHIGHRRGLVERTWEFVAIVLIGLGVVTMSHIVWGIFMDDSIGLAPDIASEDQIGGLLDEAATNVHQ